MRHFNRREFGRWLLAGAATAAVPWSLYARSSGNNPFSFLLLGDMHFDKLSHHDLEWLGREKPDDLRQVHEYSRITAELMPQLFESLRNCISGSSDSSVPPVAIVAQVGDLVEGLCGTEALAVGQNKEVIEFLKERKLGVPFFFAKGNHDVTGPGAQEAFKNIFYPYLASQAAAVNAASQVSKACCAVETGDSLFCFYDAYDKESLPWLEAALAKRTGRHCFVVLHPPVVPYGARSTWHVFSAERDKAQREHLLDLLGKHNAFVLTGHIHKFSVLVRKTSGGGRFLQLALSSVINTPNPKLKDGLSGIGHYNGDQIKVEPNFSPATEQQRRAVYDSETTFVDYFEYADLPGFARIVVDGARVSADVHSGLNRTIWRRIELSSLLRGES